MIIFSKALHGCIFWAKTNKLSFYHLCDLLIYKILKYTTNISHFSGDPWPSIRTIRTIPLSRQIRPASSQQVPLSCPCVYLLLSFDCLLLLEACPGLTGMQLVIFSRDSGGVLSHHDWWYDHTMAGGTMTATEGTITPWGWYYQTRAGDIITFKWSNVPKPHESRWEIFIFLPCILLKA